MEEFSKTVNTNAPDTPPVADDVFHEIEVDQVELVCDGQVMNIPYPKRIHEQ